MFSSIEELESHEESTKSSVLRRWMYYAGVFIVSSIAFGALYLGILFLE